jgi:DNA-binding winged helix-turn-helix (wHTH) protein
MAGRAETGSVISDALSIEDRRDEVKRRLAMTSISHERQYPPFEPSRAVLTRPWSFPATATGPGIGFAASAMSFGPFHLLPGQRLLLEGDRPVQLGSRAFDILVTLVERAGEMVSNAELRSRVWPGILVVDGNIKVQVSALRRALGEGKDGSRYILTVTGRGYQFVAPIMRSS